MLRLDLPLCLSRGHSSLLQRFLSSCAAELRPQRPLRPCLVRRPERPRAKKRVVFADLKGLALITVHSFPRDAPQPGAEPPGPGRVPPPGPAAYALGFSQPLDDYDRFRRCLEAQKVCLELCTVRGRCLQGTVQVCNVGYEKTVQMRITFSAWTAYLDEPCVYAPMLFGGDTDTFTFQVALPAGPPGPAGTIQFCFSFRCAQQIYWDNNQGYNYHLKPQTPSGAPERT
ncbi:protein phosphatase 1 regulatory subunit 3C-like [Macrotis lagotis]|uniref:protein phosphatase 1 regulatory subunit 3C-like n=1 Tax=Macrotis lagotis TaxID=92651 RepID=UPI003D682FB5